jgi:hypothetical protein
VNLRLTQKELEDCSTGTVKELRDGQNCRSVLRASLLHPSCSLRDTQPHIPAETSTTGGEMGAPVAVLLIKERHIVEAMQRIGATSPDASLTLEELADLGVEDTGVPWHALKNRVIVRQASPGKWYLDVEVWEASRRRKRRVIFALLAVMLIAAAVSLLRANKLVQ